MFGKLVGAILGALLTLLVVSAGPLVWWWDRRPEGVPAIHVLFWRWSAPESLQARLQGVLLAEQAATTRAKAVALQQAAISAAAAKNDEAAQAQIKIVTRTLTKEVPVYVTAQAVARCVVPVGFVKLWNAAASGVDVSAVPGPSGLSDDAPSGVGLDTVAQVAVGDLGGARATAKQLTDLQAWIGAQVALNPPK